MLILVLESRQYYAYPVPPVNWGGYLSLYLPAEEAYKKISPLLETARYKLPQHTKADRNSGQHFRRRREVFFLSVVFNIL